MPRARERILTMAGRASVVRPRDVETRGIPREYLSRMAADGSLVRVGRGMYALPDVDITAEHALAEIAKVVPRGVLCLPTALRFHELTTQGPQEVWLAVENKSWRPKAVPWRLHLVYMSGAAFRKGIEDHRIEGVTVRVFSPAKTVADCFKYRNKIGLDIAVEALREYLRRHRGRADELWRYAKVCRVTRVMRPYLEAVS